VRFGGEGRERFNRGKKRKGKGTSFKKNKIKKERVWDRPKNQLSPMEGSFGEVIGKKWKRSRWVSRCGAKRTDLE